MVIVSQKTRTLQEKPLIKRVEFLFIHGNSYNFSVDIAPTKAQAQLICFEANLLNEATVSRIERSDCFPITDEADALELAKLFFEKFTQ